MRKKKRIIFHIDMDAFFAAIEELRYPDIHGKPVVVGGDGDPHKRGVVSTCNYEARKYGIQSAMPLRIAYRRCPQAIYLPVDIPTYITYSKKIMSILKGFTSTLEPMGLDEAYLDMSYCKSEVEQVAKKIKERIHKKTGLTATIGIGPNRLLAKIASDLDKPDGLTLIRDDNKEKILKNLPVRRLVGVGPKTELKLKKLSVKTIGDLQKIPLKDLSFLFGKIFGKQLYQYARGIDESPMTTQWKPKSFSREMTFQKDVKNHELINNAIRNLAQDLAKTLEKKNCWARTVTVKLRYFDFETHTKSITINGHLRSVNEIYTLALQLFEKFDFSKKIRLVGIGISNLEKTGEQRDSRI